MHNHYISNQVSNYPFHHASHHLQFVISYKATCLNYHILLHSLSCILIISQFLYLVSHSSMLLITQSSINIIIPLYTRQLFKSNNTLPTNRESSFSMERLYMCAITRICQPKLWYQVVMPEFLINLTRVLFVYKTLDSVLVVKISKLTQAISENSSFH